MLHPHTGFSSQTPNANSREIGGRIIHRPIPVGAFQSRPPGGGLPQSYNMPPKASGQVDAAPISHWFHGNISREDTECLLKHNGANGTFLIRYSTSTQKYVLSVIYNQQLYHYPIEELLDGFYQVNGTNAKYLGIDLLVSEFRRANNCIVCSLGKPIFGSKPPPHITVYGCTNELHHAVRKGNLKGVRDLLNRVAASNISISEYVNEKSADSGATPLIEAAKTGSNDIVRLLLDLGAQVNLRDCGGFTALHRACQKSFAHVAETLLRANSSSSSSTPTGGGVLSTGGGGGANPQIKCPFSGNTALHEAAMLGHADCVNCLLECHAAPWARNADLEMPFELALRFGFAELANALASYQPAPPLTSQSDWYHPNLSKSDTERVLAAAASSTTGTLQDGTFLVRRSSQSERKFVLVLHYRGQSLKYQIEVVDFSFHLDTKEAYFIDKGPFHLSLEHFVEHYSRFADGIPTRLRYAVSPSGRVLNMERLLVSGIPSSSAAAAAAANTTTPPTTAGAQGRGDLVKVGGGVGHRGAPLMMHGHAFVSGRPKSQSASKRNSSSSSGMSSSGVAGAAGSGALVPAASSAAAASVLGGGSTELRLIPSDAVILLYRLGEGEFGEVYCGKLHLDNGVTQDVAVKVLVQPCQRLDFLKEASIMMRLSHENIVTIHGVCENKRLMMILELAELGSLLDFMLDYPERCQLPELYNWAMQIASGMSYLESAGFVHRDLACRNVLLASQSCAKISDFGLSRAVGVESDYYKATQRGKWPVKWYAPESIYYKTFSTASDVWSFGVCLWEMFSLGEHPYAEQDSFEVLRQLEEGVRLPRPRLASDEVYGVMLDCWAYAPEARPKFAHLLAIFRHLATNVYENVAAPAAAVVTAAAGKANGSGGVGEGRTK